ncbi:MAG: DNA-binding transcriptional repressor/biotin-[acetyl-CoA-carboxylase] ligase BirA [Sodalis sp. Psp]|nr:DNA-binding transcriptional repressor/biotin-[acetyl-CoA-carboxylase] ligase BirA [Sodalis sp. Psp]MCR3756819.1 DNA-binding transcriptional repressor/biotin-[acetyl-CoA-carboxylase] ligase BirA [Sodalis sp. Ppy]
MKDICIPLKLISVLADGEFHSDEQFSKALGMNSAAISEHIQTVRDWGVNVFIMPGKGYCLHAPLQLLDKVKILARVPAGRLEVLSVVNSTNQYLVERIDTLQSGDVCVAEHQMQGRGRRGRRWVSTFGNNLYLSIYWRLEQGSAVADGLSLMVGIVITGILKRLGVEGVRVKWPNDLYLDDRKLAGILVEMFGKAGDVVHVVIGAGINLEMSEPTASMINQDWINLQEKGIVVDRNALAAELIDALRQALRTFERNGFTPFISCWQTLDNFFDRSVKLLIGEREIWGIERGINTQGALLLEQEGKIYAYPDGEISLRGL